MFRVEPQTIQRWRHLAARRMKCLLPVLCLAGSVAASCSAQGREAGTLSTNSGALAVVLGKTVGVDQKHVALSLIFNTMLDKFARDNKLSVDESEIDAYLQGQRRRDMITILVLEKRLKDLDRDVASPILSDEAKAKKGKERAQCDKLLKLSREATNLMEEKAEDARRIRMVAAGRILKWKANQALYRQYGGRLIGPVQEPESFDGKRDYFKEQASAGSFKILDKSLESYFWNILTNETLYARLFIPDKDREDVINRPWWLNVENSSTNVPPGFAGVKEGEKQSEPEK